VEVHTIMVGGVVGGVVGSVVGGVVGSAVGSVIVVVDGGIGRVGVGVVLFEGLLAFVVVFEGVWT
jgi:hypothetical protein